MATHPEVYILVATVDQIHGAYSAELDFHLRRQLVLRASQTVTNKGLDQRSCSTPGPVNTAMDDRLRAGKPPRYVFNQPSKPSGLQQTTLCGTIKRASAFGLSNNNKWRRLMWFFTVFFRGDSCPRAWLGPKVATGLLVSFGAHQVSYCRNVFSALLTAAYVMIIFTP